MSESVDQTTFFELDGTITVLHIPHKLGRIPFSATTKIKGTKNKYHMDFDKNNLVIVFQNPPVGKIKVKWSVYE